MQTKISLHIETEDTALVERIGRAINGGGATAVEEKIDLRTNDDLADYNDVDADRSDIEARIPSGDGGTMQEPDAAKAFTETPAPAPTAESAPSTGHATATAPVSVVLDAEGLPWDERIHTSNKAKTTKGVYKRKPGITDEYRQQVVDELKQLMNVPAPAPEAKAGAPAPAPAPQPETEKPAPAPAPQPETPKTFMDVVTGITSGGFDQASVQAACTAAGIQGFQQLAQRPDLIPTFWQKLTGG